MANRYFVPAMLPMGRHRLEGDLAHHLARVLRVRPGETVRLGDGRGSTADATVHAVHKAAVDVEVATATVAPPPRRRLMLAFCVVRSPRVDWLFEHGTEVGVATFQPVWTARTRTPNERPDRWQRIVQAAAGQCDRAWLPDVQPACELATLLGGNLPPTRIVGDGRGQAIGSTDAHSDDIVLLVGPEGGFAAEELAAIERAGFTPRRFGEHTLRTETAALVGAALLLAWN